MTNRQSYIVVGAFVGGVAIAALVVVLVILLRGGDGEPVAQLVATTSTVGPTAAVSPSPGSTSAVEATPTPGGGGADAALEAFIANEYSAEHIGECPQELVESEPVPSGICSAELYRDEQLVTFILGAPFSEFFGEAVITRSPDGSWSVNFVGFGELGETVSLGSEAVVYGAGNCLNFRDSPTTSGEVQSCRKDGTTGEVVEGPEEADDHTWWRLDGLGWASEQFLRPVVE